MRGSMSCCLGGGRLSAGHLAYHCHLCTTCTFFLYFLHWPWFLLPLFWFVLLGTLGGLWLFGSYHQIGLVAWWLMALGRRRLGLMGLLYFRVRPSVPLALQLFMRARFEMLQRFPYFYGWFPLAPWIDWKFQFILGCRCVFGSSLLP